MIALRKQRGSMVCLKGDINSSYCTVAAFSPGDDVYLFVYQFKFKSEFLTDEKNYGKNFKTLRRKSEICCRHRHFTCCTALHCIALHRTAPCTTFLHLYEVRSHQQHHSCRAHNLVIPLTYHDAILRRVMRCPHHF